MLRCFSNNIVLHQLSQMRIIIFFSLMPYLGFRHQLKSHIVNLAVFFEIKCRREIGVDIEVTFTVRLI
jgi:hypothetical protein